MAEHMRAFETKAWGPKNVFEYLGYALFFLCVAFPMARPLLELKAAMFLLLVFALIVNVTWTGRIALAPTLSVWLLAIVLTGALFSLQGGALGAPGAWVYGFAIYVVWILIHSLILHGIKPAHITRLYWIAIGATIFIALNGLLFVLSQLFLSEPIDLAGLLGWNVDDDVQGYGASGGYIKINVFGINSMPFLVPMAVGAIAMRKQLRDNSGPASTAASWIALILGLLFVLIAGRRALILVTLVSPLLLAPFLLAARRSATAKHRGLLAILICVGGLVFTIAAYLNELAGDPFSIVQIVLSGFEFSSSDESESGRREQFFALFNGWLDRPLTGWGLGASAGMYGSIRSVEYPWAYELYYFALLYQVGLIGSAVYLGFVAWIYWMGIRIVQSRHSLGTFMVPFLVGMTAFLIASGTNPYLPRFDGLWVFLLPLACINLWLHSNAISPVDATPSYTQAPQRSSP